MTQTTYMHIMHFTNGEELGYAFSHLECFINTSSAEEYEFAGDDPFELVFITIKPMSQAAIKRMVAHFSPKDQKFNQ